MFQFTISGNDLFHGSAGPALLIREGVVRYFNPAAEAVYRLEGIFLREGDPAPAGLTEELPEDRENGGHCLRLLAGEEWSLTRMELPEGTLVRLEPWAEPGVLTPGQMASLGGWLAAPVQSISMAAEALERNMVETERLRHERQLARLERGIHQLVGLSWNLRLLSELEEGEAELAYPFQVLDLAGLCREMARQCDYLIESAGAVLRREEEKGCGSILVRGSEYLLSLLICQLLADALAGLYREPGEIILRVGRTEGRVLVTVELRRRSGETEPEGLERVIPPLAGGALGLSIPVCRRVARAHGGTLVFTKLKGGRRATLSLPISDGEGDTALRSMGVDFTGGFSPALVAMSGLVPEKIFRKREDE